MIDLGKRMRKTRRRGFTLMEVMAAVFVMALAAAFGATTIYLGQESRVRSAYLSKASFAAQKELDRVKSLGFVNLTAAQMYSNGLLDSTTPTSGGSRTFYFTNVDGANYDSVAKLLPSGVGTIKLQNNGSSLVYLLVTISWHDQGTVRNYTTGTMVGNL